MLLEFTARNLKTPMLVNLQNVFAIRIDKVLPPGETDSAKAKEHMTFISAQAQTVEVEESLTDFKKMMYDQMRGQQASTIIT